MGVRTGSLAISVAVVLCVVVLLVEHVDKSVALKCYACTNKGMDPCPNDDKGVLIACTQKDPICYDEVKRKPVLDKDGKPVKFKKYKGCIDRAHVEEEYRNLLGCAYRTEHLDQCQCNTDRCNSGDDWPERDESTVPK